MKRTQVYIDVDTYRMAKQAAEERGQTVSELIRTALAKTLFSQTKKPAEAERLLEQFYRKHRFPNQTPADLATNLDKYLYDPANN